MKTILLLIFSFNCVAQSYKDKFIAGATIGVIGHSLSIAALTMRETPNPNRDYLTNRNDARAMMYFGAFASAFGIITTIQASAQVKRKVKFTTTGLIIEF
jgi:hypothetical protein